MLAGGAGIVFLVLAAMNVSGPYTQTNQLVHVMNCDDGMNCTEDRDVSVVGRRTYTTTRPSGASSTESPLTDTNYEITWAQPDGSLQAHAVSNDLYDVAHEGQPVTLRMWHGEIIGVTAGTVTDWFIPKAVASLAFWVTLGVLGAALLAWGLLTRWRGSFS
ncbi:hypothetical protein [Nocardia lijiangensis]|uniref:hypothetical protein n=1 Tax=Nocardia lijiangensis TaxID=299618 RepID=UPI003D73C927